MYKLQYVHTCQYLCICTHKRVKVCIHKDLQLYTHLFFDLILSKKVYNMARMGRINFYGDLDEWDKLQFNIDCNRSKWLNEMIKKQNQAVDEIEVIEMEIQSIENQEKALAFDKSNLLERRNMILKQREMNEENIRIVEEAMSTIRMIASNYPYVELDRVKRIASNHVLDVDVLIKQMKKENIEVRDVPIVKEQLKGYDVGRLPNL